MFGSKKQIELGDIARDTITGFQGVVIGDTKWLHGCRRLTIQPQELKDGKPIDALTMDELQLELVKPERATGTTGKGGPGPEPTQRATPSR